MPIRSSAGMLAAAILTASSLLTAAPAAMANSRHNSNPNSPTAALRWRDVTPSPRVPGSFWYVSCIGARACLALGGGSSLTWNGSRWSSPSTLPPSAGTFDGVSCVRLNQCTAVGTTGPTTLADRWNGSRWKTQKIPTPLGSNTAILNAVSCSSSTSCTAVGYYTSQSQDYFTLAEHWNGKGWRIQRIPTPTGRALSMLNGVSCPSASYCVAVGMFSPGISFVEIWNGTSWKVHVFARPKGAGVAGLGAVSCSSTSACTAVGEYSGKVTGFRLLPLAERWNDKTWRTQLPAVPAGAVSTALESVSCPSARACIVSGNSNDTNGLMAEIWNGSRWAVQTIEPPRGTTYDNLTGLSCNTAVNCMAVGGFDQSGPNWNLLAEHYS